MSDSHSTSGSFSSFINIITEFNPIKETGISPGTERSNESEEDNEVPTQESTEEESEKISVREASSSINKSVDSASYTPESNSTDNPMDESKEAGENTSINKTNNSRKVKFPSNENELVKQISPIETRYYANHTKIMNYCLILALCGFPLGWDVGTTGSLISHKSFRSVYGESSSFRIGVIISSFNVGCLIGCLSLGQIKINLKNVIRMSLAVYLVGTLLELLVSVNGWNIWMYVVGRLFCGVCCGSLCVIGPIYMNELIIDDSKRGIYLSFFQTLVCVCILCGNLTNLLYDKLNWMFLIVDYIKLAYFIVFNLLLFVIPNSIKYHLKIKSASKLDTIFKKIYKNSDHQLIEKEINNYDEPASQGSWFWIFSKSYLNRTLICCCLMGFQQLTGINYFFYFGNILFNSTYSVIVLSLINLMGGLISGKVIENFDIKKILIFGSFFMSFLMILYSTLGNFLTPQNPAINVLLIVITCLFILSFSISWGPCSGILNNLISENKNEIIGLSISVNWIINFVISIITPIMISKFEFNYGFIFCFNLIVMGIFVTYFI